MLQVNVLHVRFRLSVVQIASLPRDVFILFAVFAFINPAANPFIYAARYDVFRRYLRETMANKISVVSSVAQNVQN